MTTHDWLLAIGSSVTTAAAGILAQLATGRLVRTLVLLPFAHWVSRRGTPEEAELLHEARVDLGLDYPTYSPPPPPPPPTPATPHTTTPAAPTSNSTGAENTGVPDGHE